MNLLTGSVSEWQVRASHSSVPFLEPAFCKGGQYHGRAILLCLAKIESAPLVEHIADVHHLNLETTEGQMPDFELPARELKVLKGFSDRPFPELSNAQSTYMR